MALGVDDPGVAELLQVVGERGLGDVEQRDELAHADLACVFAKHVDELQADRVPQGLCDLGHAHSVIALDVRVDDRLAAAHAGRALDLRGELHIDRHRYTYINSTDVCRSNTIRPVNSDSQTEVAAVITDIHANLPALHAAFARIEQLGIERVYCGGDLVGYGPHPNEVCQLIAEREIPTIYGNYDYAIAREEDDCGCAYITPHDRELGQLSVDWTLAHTSRESKDFMLDLPFDLHFSVGEVGVHLVHGSPRKVNEYLFEDKPPRLYERLAAAETDPVLVFGHTHKPWVHDYGGVLFVNCGSVGKPKDADPRGAFAVLRPNADSVEVTIERVEYDAAGVADEVRGAGLPGEFADKLLTGT